jgi:hypothetical protein
MLQNHLCVRILRGDAFIQDDTPECQVLWEMATESVFELADKLDDSDNKK